MNAPLDQPDRDLTRTLTREADRFVARGGTELGLDQVLARAGEIRRGRRMRATLVMAACVLAIAVPAAVIALQSDRTEPTPPAHQVRTDESPLTLEGLGHGADPGSGYVQDGALHLGGFTYSSTREQYRDFASFAGGVLVAIEGKDGAVRASASTISPTGHTQSYPASWPMSGGFAVSPGGHVAAFVEPDGTPVVVQAGAWYALPRIPRGSGFGVVAVSGEDCKESATSTGCTVWVNSNGRKPEPWVSDSHGLTDIARSRLRSVADIAEGRFVAGITQVSDTGSCSEVEGFDAETALWSTCEHRFLSFSPDGGHLLASGAYADGMGDSSLAILDSATGKARLNLSTSPGAVITQMTWEDDGHVLATIFENDRWAVVRIGLDGKREYAVSPVAAVDITASPFVLPAR